MILKTAARRWCLFQRHGLSAKAVECEPTARNVTSPDSMTSSSRWTKALASTLWHVKMSNDADPYAIAGKPKVKGRLMNIIAREIRALSNALLQWPHYLRIGNNRGDALGL